MDYLVRVFTFLGHSVCQDAFEEYTLGSIVFLSHA